LALSNNKKKGVFSIKSVSHYAKPGRPLRDREYCLLFTRVDQRS
jgi:hypothetical protein